MSVTTSDDSTGPLESRSLKGGVETRYHVAYDYAVAGAEYSGTRIGLRPSAARVAGQRDRFAVGRSFDVHYNPSNPDDSVIDARVPASNIVGATIGAFLLAWAVRVYRRTVRRSRA